MSVVRYLRRSLSLSLLSSENKAEQTTCVLCEGLRKAKERRASERARRGKANETCVRSRARRARKPRAVPATAAAKGSERGTEVSRAGRRREARRVCGWWWGGESARPTEGGRAEGSSNSDASTSDMAKGERWRTYVPRVRLDRFVFRLSLSLLLGVNRCEERAKTPRRVCSRFLLSEPGSAWLPVRSIFL